MNTYSFATGGFCFHLQQIGENQYKDQHGGIWLKNGNRLLSEGGMYNYTIKPEDQMDNKEFAGYARSTRFQGNRERFYHDRLLLMGK